MGWGAVIQEKADDRLMVLIEGNIGKSMHKIALKKIILLADINLGIAKITIAAAMIRMDMGIEDIMNIVC